MANDVTATLGERNKTHGSYENQAGTSQILKSFCKTCPNWDKLSSVQSESIELILMKISRIMHGDQDYIDSYRDIAGYAQLVVQYLSNKDGATDAKTTKTIHTNGEWRNTED